MSNGKTCAVVVTYNRLALLKECLQALQSQTMEVSHIVVYDNASDDGTREYLDSITNDQIVVFHSDSNLGGAGGFSNGLKAAYERTDDQYFWLMDDDTIVAEDCNEELVAAQKKLANDASFLISNVRWINNEPANVMLPSDNWPEKIDDGIVQVKYGSFVSYSISRAMVKRYGFPIGEMFIWGDDTEYSRRLSREKPGYFVIAAHAMHKSKSNNVASGLDQDTNERIDRYFYLYRNSMYTARKYDGLKGVLKLIVDGLKMFCKICFKSKQKKLKRCYVMIKGLNAGMWFKPFIG